MIHNIGAQSGENKTVLGTEGFLKALGKKDFTVIKKNKYIEKEFLSLIQKNKNQPFMVYNYRF